MYACDYSIVSVYRLYQVKTHVAFSMKEKLPQSDQKTLAICKYYEWFRPAIDKWLDLAKLKAFQRIRRAAELDRLCTGDSISYNYFVKHGTAANDATVCFYQVKHFAYIVYLLIKKVQ